MTRKLRYAFLMIVLALAAEAASAQVTGGTPPFGSFGGGPDVINLANLNSHIGIPVLHKAGRGLNFTYDLSYDSSLWYPVTSGGTTSWQPVYNWGWRAQTEAATGYVSYAKTITRLGGQCTDTIYDNYVYHDAWGVGHSFGGQANYYNNPHDSCTNCDPALTGCFYGFSSVASDGSGYSVNVADGRVMTGPVVYNGNGRVILAPQNIGTGAGSSTDRNGNYISLDGSGNFTDTLGQIALTAAGNGTPSSPTTLTYTPPSNTPVHYTVNYTNYTVATNFGLSGTSEYKSSTALPLVSSIVLPDNSQYTIQYEATPSTPSAGACTPYAGTTCVTARIKSVILPTGGSITYTYTGGSNGIFADGSTAGLKRVLSDGASWNATWTYSRSGTVPATTTTIVDPQGNQTISSFSGLYETQRQVFQGTSTLLETLLICYNNNFSNCATATVTAPITKRDVYRSFPNLANPAVSETTYNSYGQLTEDKEIDFVPAPNGSPYLSDKLITILTVGTYQAIQTAQIKDNSGNVKAQTTMIFDEGPGGGVTATSGTPQHTNPTVGRGNPTTIRYLVQGATSLTKTFTYYDTGNAQTATDVNGAQTSFTYGACGNSFPTSISEPLGLSQSMAWNCTGGVETSATDENTKTASTSYTDTQFWRPHSTTDQLLNATTLTYSGQTSAESSMPFNGSSSTSDTLVTLDGLGRRHISQTKQSPSSSQYDSVETDYDVVGRPYRVTIPYSAAAGQPCTGACPATTTTYDALGRVLTVTDAGGGTASFTYSQNDVYQTLGPAPTVPTVENTKRRQLEYDGLGRLTSVCEITAGTTNAPAGNCAQNVPRTGYWTKYTYDANGNLTGVTQNAQATSGQQTRSYSYDDLSRMTSETNPESGTKNYTYDSDSTMCGNGASSSPGNLVKTTDAAGNCVMRYYDLLHRLTDAATNRPSIDGCKRFRYDNTTGVLGSIPSGVSVSNVLGRLAEAETDTCTPWPITQSSIITDEWFSYTARGETSDQYESTLHSGGYYHLGQAYWASGATSQLSSLAGLPTISYGVDGEGRSSTVSASSGQNPVTGTTYNPYSSPPQTTVNFGSGDSDVFTFDSNTGRTTQYKFNVGSAPQSVVGQLNWNPNGSLGSLAIADPFNSSNAQTCTYMHDDLERIAGSPTVPGVNCVNGSQQTVWSQTFSFDAFGNINKAGNSSFSASYSPSTNRMTTIGSSTPSYDGNGNVTNDFLHTYTWNADGRPVTIDSVGATYDALGRMVELNRSGTYTEIAYTPTGEELALMSGQTLQRAFVSLPGGATAVYTSSGLDHYRHSDWLGSARLATTPSRTVYGDVAYAPYGETYAASGNNDFSWTGINADVEPANPETLYDFPAREYGIQGRWPSPDPAGLGAVDPSIPQSWNRYAYVLNNPLAATDPTGLFIAIPPVSPDPVSNIIIGIIDLIGFLSSLFGGGAPPPPPPQAAPPPQGGYGAGIDPYGTWDEKLPAGVQVFPRVGFPGINLPTGSTCDWGGCDYRRPHSHPPYKIPPKSILSQAIDLIRSKPWMLSWIFPLAGPVPGVVGVGPAGSIAYNPETSTICASVGLGASVGDNVSVGPITGVHTSGNNHLNDILNGGSISGGYNFPHTGMGAQGTVNGSGSAWGPTMGVPGLSGAATDAACW